MADNATPIANLLEHVEEFSKTTVELFKLNAIDKIADVMSSLISEIAIFITVALSLFVITIGLALWIGELLGKSFYGFFIIGIFYCLLAFLLNIFHVSLIKLPVSNAIIRKLQKKDK